MNRLNWLAVLVVVISMFLACKAAPATPTAGASRVGAPASATTAPKAGTPAPTATKATTGPGVSQVDESVVPEAWIEGAKKEGKLAVLSTVDPPEFQKIFAAFQSRYPFVKELNFTKSSHEVRAVKTLVEFKLGRVNYDIIHGLGGEMRHYKEAKALDDLTNLPLWKIYPADFKDSEGHWISWKLDYWGIAYNTKLVNKADLPKTWEQLINPKWKGRQIALGNRPQLWAVQLWKAWGPEKTKAFLKDLFALEPQMRKEGMNAMVTLAAAGEFKMNFPAGHYRVKQMADEGGPVAWCWPEPAPVAMDELVIMKGSPNPYTARIFANWQLSQEGQKEVYKHTEITPPHPALQTKDFLPYPDEVIGKKKVVRRDVDLIELLPPLQEYWQTLWLEK
jgi:iron(III) transport system substrate-binding protein